MQIDLSFVYSQENRETVFVTPGRPEHDLNHLWGGEHGRPQFYSTRLTTQPSHNVYDERAGMLTMRVPACGGPNKSELAVSTDQELAKQCKPTAVTYIDTMLYVIGLGLCDEKDITVRGLEASTPTVYLREQHPDPRSSRVQGRSVFHPGLPRSLHQHPHGPKRTPGKSKSHPRPVILALIALLFFLPLVR